MLPEQRGGSRDVPRRSERPSGGRHRAEPTTSGAVKALRTTGAVSALIGGGLVVAAGPANAATANDFYKLRMCESGGNYSINTGNGFYGAYQFDAGTWHGLGYSGLPSDAPPALQDQAAYKLYDSRGWSPWPSCSVSQGLTNNGAAPPAPNVTQTTDGSSTDSTTTAPLTFQQALAQLKSMNFPGATLSTQMAGEVRPDALVWQNQMRKKGFMLTVDGRFGAQSRDVASLGNSA
jgi:hypothetical protein